MVALLLKRYLWLIDTLRRSGRGLTLAEINARWTDDGNMLCKDCGGGEIDRRTLYNHRNAIADLFGVEIKVVKAGQYSRYVVEPDAFGNNKILDWLLKAAATENLIVQSYGMSDKILLESVDSSSVHLQTITEALKSDLLIEVDYQSFHLHSSAYKSLKVEPLALKMFKRRWYLLCRKSGTNDMRLLALDRMSDCRITDQHFVYPPDFKPDEYFENYFGVSMDGYTNTPCKVILRAFYELPRYLESQPLHHTQEIIRHTTEYTEFGYYLIPAFDFVQEILLHGDQLEVVEPQLLRQRIAKILKKSQAFYE